MNVKMARLSNLKMDIKGLFNARTMMSYVPSSKEIICIADKVAV